MKAPPTKPVPIRIDEELGKRLGRAARRLGSNRSAVIRLAILNQLSDIESGRITLNAMRKEAV